MDLSGPGIDVKLKERKERKKERKEGTKHHDVYTQHVLIPSEAAGMRETGCPLQGFSLLFHLY